MALFGSVPKTKSRQFNRKPTTANRPVAGSRFRFGLNKITALRMHHYCHHARTAWDDGSLPVPCGNHQTRMARNDYLLSIGRGIYRIEQFTHGAVNENERQNVAAQGPAEVRDTPT